MIHFKEILILVAVLCVFLLILVAYRDHTLEHFATLQSSQLLGLMNHHLQSEQELSRNIVATAQAEVDEGQRDVDQATLNERDAQEELDRAVNELSMRKSNLENIRSTLLSRIPPA